MSTSIMLQTPHKSTLFGKSNLTEQLQVGQTEGDKTPRRSETTTGSPKPRSLSDAPKLALSPSPAFREPRRISKDDADISPTTPRRSTFHSRGLSLQVPSKDTAELASPQIARVPLSPKLETSNIYGSPASMLPRHSRGLDFTRACTNLHHSTLADSTPDASPVAGKGIQIPQRRSLGDRNTNDANISSSMWTSMPQEKTTLSSSVSSINMLDSDSDSDDSSEDMALDRDIDDPVLNTPAASRPLMGLFSNMTNSPGNEWMSITQPSPAQTSLMNFQNMMSYRRSKWRKGKSQHSSSSVSMRSSRPSPGPASPPIVKSVETGNEGYFSGLTKQQLQSRRESLSLGTDDLHLSDSEENEMKMTGQSVETTGAERGVIRRAVTRRSNLLPKTKGFARIKAALLEESAPVDSEVRREAEVIKQVNENDTDYSRRPSTHISPKQSITDRPSIDSPDEDLSITNNENGLVRTESFSQQAERNSAGPNFWNAFDQRYRTPPPAFLPRESSSAVSDETMDTPSSSMANNNNDNPNWKHLNRSRSRSTTPLSMGGPTAEEVARKVNKKRRRDDDFDPASFKRRAVSPGMSVQSSPILPQSPVLTADKSWGRPPKAPNDRSNSGGSVNGGVKRVGLQGMNEANDGFMSMSID